MPAALQPAALGSQSRSEDGGIVPPAAARGQGGTEEAQRSGTNSSMSGREQRTSATGGAHHRVSTRVRILCLWFFSGSVIRMCLWVGAGL